MNLFKWDVFGKKDKKSKKDFGPPEITLLIIGTRSCGKTALIYYLYSFAINYLIGSSSTSRASKTNRANSHARNQDRLDTGSSETQTPTHGNNVPSQVAQKKDELIVPYRYDEFIKEVETQIKEQKDFQGTSANYCNFMSYDFKSFKLNLYNLPGEWFTNEGDFHDQLLKFAQHIDKWKDSNIFCLLCAEPTPPKSTFKDKLVRTVFHQYPTALQVLSNIRDNVNTMRVITKFDRVLRQSLKVEPHRSKRQERYEVYSQAIDLLSRDDFYYKVHEKEFETPDLESFTMDERTFYKRFFCTGLYNRSKPSDPLFTDGTDKKGFTEEHVATNLQQINMFGIEEIWYSILGSLDMLEQFPFFNGRDKRYPLNPDNTKGRVLTLEQYNKITGID